MPTCVRAQVDTPPMSRSEPVAKDDVGVRGGFWKEKMESASGLGLGLARSAIVSLPVEVNPSDRVDCLDG